MRLEVPFENGVYTAGTGSLNNLDEGYSYEVSGKECWWDEIVESERLAGLIKSNAKQNNGVDLVITSDSECGNINLKHWKSITVNAGLCNSMKSNLDISNYGFLRTIVIKSSSTSAKTTLGNVKVLTISNNPLLEDFVTEDGYSLSSDPNKIYYYGCFRNSSLVLESLTDLFWLIWSSSTNFVENGKLFIQ